MKRKHSVPMAGRYAALFDEVLRERRGVEPEWLTEQRGVAFERVMQTGFPTTKVEAWTYTDVSALAAQDFVHGTALGELPPGALDGPLFREEDLNLVFVDGLFREELSSRARDEAVRVLSLGEAADTPVLRAAFSRTNPAMESAFVCLNRALWRDGVALSVPGKRRVTQRVHVCFVHSDGATERISSPRLILALGDLAEARVTISHVGSGSARHLSNGVVDIHVGHGARLDLCHISSAGHRALQLCTTRITQGRDSHVRHLEMTLGSALVRHDLRASLRGEGGELVLDGLYAPRQREIVDFHTVIEHTVPNCTSRQLYKGMVQDQATATFNGMVRVHPGASGTDGEQLNRNLLLSPGAKVNSKPELEILNDDVRCTHGATIGQLDARELFYLQSRGLSPEAAARMLSRGFVEEVLFRMPDTRRRSDCQQLLDAWWDVDG